MEKRLYQLVEIFTVIMLMVFFFQVAEARFADGGCACYYTGSCEFDDDGIGYRYMQCTGSCYAYSNWVEEPRCQAPHYPSDYYPYDWKYS